MARPRRIALIAPPWYPVPPSGYGGTELVVALLAAQLRKTGDEVVLLGSDGSELASHEIAPREWTDDLGTTRERLRELSYAGETVRALRQLGDVDLIHDHCGMSTLLAVAATSKVPVVHTVHGPIGEPEQAYYSSLPASVSLVAISEAHRATAPSLHLAGVVHNAVDSSQLVVATPREKREYLLCMARICADKGQHEAIEVARRVGMKLVLAGKVEETESGREYFETRIRPHIDGDDVVHLPNVAGDDKARILACATALLAPLAWEEPFGLALAEAMASGTPAIAYPRGAAPELIAHGVTGFLVHGVEEMAEAVRSANTIEPEKCASVTRDRFSPERMAAGYSTIYDLRIGIDGQRHREQAAS